MLYILIKEWKNCDFWIKANGINVFGFFYIFLFCKKDVRVMWATEKNREPWLKQEALNL